MMINIRMFLGYAATGLLVLALIGGQTLMAAEAPKDQNSTTATSKPAITTAKETASSTVEDGGTGSFKAVMVSDSSLTTHTIYRPKDMNAFGEKVKLPIIAWGNGGCANSNSSHQNYLSEIASHGFLVVAIGPYQPAGQRGRGGAAGGMPDMGGRGGAMGGNVPGAAIGDAPGGAGGMRMGATGGTRGGAGGGMGSSTKSSQLLDAVDWAIAQNSDKASIYYNKIDISKIGVAGHSCGGLQALEVSTDPRITTTIVVDSGIINSGGGTGGTRGVAPGGMPGAGGARGGATGGVPAGAIGGMPGGAAGGMPGMGGARGGAGGGMMGMPALTKDHLAKLHGPVFYLLGGESDMAYPNGTDDFKRIEKIPVFMANQDVGHGGTFGQQHGGDWAMVSIAWFKWQLKSDKEAGKLFTGNPCGLTQDKKWTVEKKNIP
jgi:hypothetical protein